MLDPPERLRNVVMPCVFALSTTSLSFLSVSFLLPDTAVCNLVCAAYVFLLSFLFISLNPFVQRLRRRGKHYASVEPIGGTRMRWSEIIGSLSWRRLFSCSFVRRTSEKESRNSYYVKVP